MMGYRPPQYRRGLKLNNVMNINTFKDMGVKTSVIEVDEEVKKWE